MKLELANIAFDCADPQRVAAFWSEALGRPIDPDPTEFFASIGAADPAITSFFFAKVPEDKWSELVSQAWQVEPPP